jgi:hypothetical protein
VLLDQAGDRVGAAPPAFGAGEREAASGNVRKGRRASGVHDGGGSPDLSLAVKLTGPWLSWLDREFGWVDKTAEKWMNVYKLSLKFEVTSNLDVPIETLCLLAARNTPPVVVEEIAKRTEDGETFSGVQVQQMIKDATDKIANFANLHVYKLSLIFDTVSNFPPTRSTRLSIGASLNTAATIRAKFRLRILL